jgi:signal transduction histidine kinase
MDESDFKAVDIHGGIDSTLLILPSLERWTRTSNAIQVTRDYGNLPLVQCYPSQLNQAFMNILANAIDTLEKSAYNKLIKKPRKILTELPSRLPL